MKSCEEVTYKLYRIDIYSLGKQNTDFEIGLLQKYKGYKTDLRKKRKYNKTKGTNHIAEKWGNRGNEKRDGQFKSWNYIVKSRKSKYQIPKNAIKHKRTKKIGEVP